MKVAVIVPAPSIVAVVVALVGFGIIVSAVLLDHLMNRWPMAGFALIVLVYPLSYQLIPLGIVVPCPSGFTAKTTLNS